MPVPPSLDLSYSLLDAAILPPPAAFLAWISIHILVLSIIRQVTGTLTTLDTYTCEDIMI